MSMGRNYASVLASSTAQSSTLLIAALGMAASPAVRPSIYDIVIGSDSTPADNATTYAFQRFTTSGTGTAVTPQALDPADPAATALAQQAQSVGGTLSGPFLMDIALNQRATVRWVAAPGSELRIPATSGSGIGCAAFVNTANYNAKLTFMHNE